MSAKLDTAIRWVTSLLRRTDRILATPTSQHEDLATIITTLHLLLAPGQGRQLIERSRLQQGELIEVAVLLRPIMRAGRHPYRRGDGRPRSGDARSTR